MSSSVYYKRPVDGATKSETKSAVAPEAPSAEVSGLERKLDSLNDVVAHLGHGLSLKADASRVGDLEKGLRSVRWQLYALGVVLACAQLWLYFYLHKH